MKAKYLFLYYLSSFFVFLSYLIFCLFDNYSFFQNINNSLFFNKYISVMIIINLVLLIVNVFLNIKRYKFDIKHLKMPIIFLIFYFIMAILVVIMNNYLLFKWIEFSYYFMFVLINYLFLNIYTMISFKKNHNTI